MARVVTTDGKLEVKKSEFIVKARYKMNPLAIKFISTIIANLKRTDEDNEEYVFKINEFKDLTGQKTKRIYELLDEATEELLNNPLKIPREDGGFLKFNWIADADYQKGSGIISFTISPKLRPFLIEAQQKYLKYNLENILPLKSGYSIRMYEILKDYYNTQSRYGNKVEKIIEVSKLREMLEIPKSYKYGNSSGIKQRILEKSKQELKEHTDIVFDYEEIKIGRKVGYLKFIIQLNPKKLQEQEKEYLKSFKHFVSFVRNKYKANMKYFVGWNGLYFGINKQGLVYSNKRDLDPQESEKVFKQAYKYAKNSAVYKSILEDSLDFKDDLESDSNLYQIFKEELQNGETT